MHQIVIIIGQPVSIARPQRFRGFAQP